MKFIKMFLILLCGALLFLPVVSKAEEADDEEAKVYFFHGSTCQFCHKALAFFDSIEDEYGSKFELVKYEVWGNADNAALMKQVEAYLDIVAGGVPFFIIGDQVFDKGYNETLNDSIISAIEAEYANNFKFNIIEDAIANSVEPEPEDNTLESVIIVIVLVAATGLVVFARNSTKRSSGREKSSDTAKEKKDYDSKKTVDENTNNEPNEKKKNKNSKRK